MISTDQEIGTIEVSRILGVHRSLVVLRAIQVDPANARQVRAAFKEKRLPGRKVGRFWLFRRQHVIEFGQIPRPSGRPAKLAV